MDKKVIINRIEELMKERHITHNALKENADISSTIYQWKSNKSRDATRNPSLKSIEKICNYFGISLSQFFAFDSAERTKAKQTELIRLTDNMSDEQLDALTNLAKTMVDTKKEI